ncbi:MAG: D-alanine--D-alanine ligase [Pirellulaceae bacterium]|jgi:D-alanine-D-alanine ligase|nr:D-alanine--D-alanine ligase [Pirellulaceae bacterium]
MRVGLTYDLRSEYRALGFDEHATAEFDHPETIDALEAALRKLGYDVQRIGHCKALVQRLASGDRWDLVFNICEGMFGLGREAQVPALLDAYQIPYTFADALMMSVCLHKEITKTLVAKAGIPTPQSILIDRVEQLAQSNLKYPVFAKPVAQGTSKGISPASRAASLSELKQACDSLIQQFREPVIIEQYLPGREFTVGILGTGNAASVLGTLEIAMREDADQHVYTYRNKEECESLIDYRLVLATSDPVVATAESLALQAYRVLNCCDAGRVDLRCNTVGEPELIEVNPLAGLHPTHSDLPMLATAVGMPYVELIRRIMDSAKARVTS